MPTASTADSAMQGFVAHLRGNGYAVGGGDAALALQALALLPPLPLSQGRVVLRSLFVGERGEWERFDELFDAYWLGRGMRAAQPTKASPAARRLWSAKLPSLADNPALAALPSANEEETAAAGDDELATAGNRRQGSRRHGSGQMDAGTALNRAQLQQCGAALAATLCRRRSRRRIAAKRGEGVDFRRTMRKNLSAGGEPLSLVRQATKTQSAQLAVLLDVSASMKEHFGFFLFLLKGMLSAQAAVVEVFIFHTRLVRLSSSLAPTHGGMKTLEKFALQTQGVGGGTRIAGCLEDFMRIYGARCLGGRRTVLVISDGYDSVAPAALEQAAAQLARRVPRLFWLSPSLSVAGEMPAALAAAQQHLTALSSVRTIADVYRLCKQWRVV